MRQRGIEYGEVLLALVQKTNPLAPTDPPYPTSDREDLRNVEAILRPSAGPMVRIGEGLPADPPHRNRLKHETNLDHPRGCVKGLRKGAHLRHRRSAEGRHPHRQAKSAFHSSNPNDRTTAHRSQYGSSGSQGVSIFARRSSMRSTSIRASGSVSRTTRAAFITKRGRNSASMSRWSCSSSGRLTS